MNGPHHETTESSSSTAKGNGKGGVEILEAPASEQHLPDLDTERGKGQAGREEPQPRSRRFQILAATVAIVLAISVGVPYYLYARVHVSTDDAFVEGHVVRVSPRVAGHVAKVYVTDNQWVNAGDLLVELDSRDFEARLAGATAQLAAARAVAKSRSIDVDVTEITSSAGVEEATGVLEAAKADVETARAAVVTAESQRVQRDAQLLSAQAALKQAEADVEASKARRDAAETHFGRFDQLAPHHAVSEESLDEARAAARVAEAAATAAQQRVFAAEATVKQAEAAVGAAESELSQAKAGVTASLAGQSRAAAQLAAANSAPKQVAQSESQKNVAQAEVDQAQAGVEQARLNLSYTKVYAPVSGHVTRKSVEPGAFVQVGQALLAVVEPELWVVANFKETQLTRMRPGQPVEVEVDTYPGTKFSAHVQSIQRGAGARFSLLPPENATGNYVKVVQRVPVKIVFDDPSQLEAFTLGPGMSVVPTVDVRSTDTQTEVAAAPPRTAALSLVSAGP